MNKSQNSHHSIVMLKSKHTVLHVRIYGKVLFPQVVNEHVFLCVGMGGIRWMIRFYFSQVVTQDQLFTGIKTV